MCLRLSLVSSLSSARRCGAALAVRTGRAGYIATSILRRMARLDNRHKIIGTLRCLDMAGDEEVILQAEYLTGQDWRDERSEYEGYAVRTSKRVIRVLISSHCSCCEDYGVAMRKPSKETDLVGAEVTSVEWGKKVSDELVSAPDDRCLDWADMDNSDLHYAVVDIKTSLGLVQLVAYNEHNGYYPHTVCVSWGGYEDQQEL